MNSAQLSRRRFLALTSGMAMMTALAACAPTTAPQAGQPAAGEQAAAPAAEQVDLRLTFWGDLADMPTWNWGMDQFREAHPTINVQWENTPWTEYWTKLQTEVAGGTTPDVVGMVSMYSQQYIRQGTLLPLNQYIEREPDVEVEDFWPLIMQAYTWEGDRYCFPYDLSTMLLMYNKTLFDEAGVAYPTGEWTWDEFLAACQAITKDTDGDGKVDQFGWLLPNFDWTIDVPLSTNGARAIAEDGTKALFDTPEAIETIQWLSDLRNVHHVVPTIAEQGDIPLFETGRSGMAWGNPEAVQTFTTRIGPPRDNPNFLWDVALFPKKTQNGNSTQGGSFAIGKSTAHAEEAWTFLKFYTSAPILKEMVGVPSRGIPGRMSIADSLVNENNPEHQQFFLDVMEYSISTFIPTYERARSTWRKYLDQVFLNEMTAAEAAPQMTAEIDAILQEGA